MRTLAIIAEAQRQHAGAFFKTESEAWDMAARIADECTTYQPQQLAGRWVLNAYDETGFWLGRL